MPAVYQVRIYDEAGQVQTVFEDFRSLVIEHRVNYASTLTLSLYELHDAVQYFELDSLIEVRRQVSDVGLDWYTEYVGMHRTSQRQLTSEGQRIFTSYSRGLLDLINRRSIRYYADTDGSAKGPGPADDIIKLYVYDNAAFGAGDATRVSYGRTPGLVVAALQGLAPTYEGAHAWKNLLTAIREIGEANHVDFDVLWTGGMTWRFRTYYPFMGTDRRAGIGADQVVFAPEMGNVTNISYTRSRTDEVTSVLVLGPGEGPRRDTTLREDTGRKSESVYNLIEQDQDASQEDREAALNAIGDGVLYDKRPVVNFTCDIIQTPQSTYYRHYRLGDIVTGRLSGISASVKIRAVTINVTAPSESVRLELEEYTE